MTAIEFDNISKQYRLGLVSTQTLSHDLKRWWTVNVRRQEDPYLRIGETNDRSSKGNSDYVWALKDINFKVEQGDVVGIIGRNGAGKSTLLKLLSRVTAPTTGQIRARGRIGSLLEVGTGFHPEMTGRENIFMNGAILGMTRAEVARKLDEIVDFSGCERYLDTPVKRYSSGMMVRLGFAVAAHLDPEILVVDEVLAVGDAEFQKKAIGKMKDVSQGEGRTVLFVSHNMQAVQSLCDKGILLQNGTIVYEGTSKDTVGRYLQVFQNTFEAKRIVETMRSVKSFINLSSVRFNGTEDAESTIRSNQEYLDVEFCGQTSEALDVDIKITIKSMSGIPLATLAEGHYKGVTTKVSPGPFTLYKKILLPSFFASGDYLVDICLHQPEVQYYCESRDAVVLHADGNVEGYGRAPILQYEGILGLETL